MNGDREPLTPQQRLTISRQALIAQLSGEQPHRAREEPAKLVAAAAATGALVVLVKPWRLLSITAVLAAVLKTSDVADLVTTLMKRTTNPRKDAP
jgi:hypothetical protein